MKAWKKLLICGCSFTFVYFLNLAFDLACGPEIDPYDYYTSFFHNNLQGEKDYGAFYLSWNEVFSDEEPESQDEINAREWSAYLNLKAPLDTGFRVDPEFIKALNARQSAKAYWAFALATEPLANLDDGDRWDPKPHNTTKQAAAAAEAFQLAKKEDDAFCKLRYYYQAQRLYHYSKNYKEAANVYDKYIAPFSSKSHVKGWALSCRAGEARWLKDTVRAAYLFSKVFAQYPERRVLAYKNYHYMDNIPREPLLAMAMSDNERSQIYALEAFGNPEFALPNLEQVYALNPTSPMVGTLLVREINKLEEGYLTPKLGRRIQGQDYLAYWDNSGDDDRKKQLPQVASLRIFCLKLAQQKKYPQPAIGYMAAAYLDWMTDKPAEGLKTLGLADNEKLSKKLTDAVNLLRLLLQAQSITTLNSQTENQLQPLLAWLDKRVSAEVKETKNEPEGQRITRFLASSRDFYDKVMAPAYLKQKDTVKAALCILKSTGEIPQSETGQAADISYYVPFFWENHLKSSHVGQLLNYRLHAPSNQYLNILAANLKTININFYYDLLGTAFLREHNYPKAVEALKHIPLSVDQKWLEGSEEAANPFVAQLPDYPKDFGDKKYTKLMFAQAMADFQMKIKTSPPTAADSYYRMAVGLYNASHYGNAYYLISYNWSSTDYGRKPVFSYDADYIQTRTAERYFLLARHYTNSVELRAKCTFMAAKCKQKTYILPDMYSWHDKNDYTAEDKKYSYNMVNNPYFGELSRAYAKTNFYKTAVHECSYLRDFLRGQAAAKKPTGKK